MSVLVFIDINGGKLQKSAFEAVYYANKIAQTTGLTTTVITYGDSGTADLSSFGNYGASKVLHAKSLNTTDTQVLAALVAQAAQAENASIIIFSHDFTGKGVAPRVAVKLKAGYIPGAIDYPNTQGNFSVRKNVFSGKAIAQYEIKTEKKVLSLMPNSITIEAGDAKANVENFDFSGAASRIQVKEVKKKGSGGLNLTEAEIVVSAGRGLKGPENWGMVEELAEALGAATACSRPVADIGWRPHHEHVGQTGVAIRPNLYIAIGISGAIQHLAGVNGSKVMVVINKDPEAPFFKAADYGIIGDAFEIVPKLVEAAKKFKASQN
jgi:electron transfer flavoprotein alpha subunit